MCYCVKCTPDGPSAGSDKLQSQQGGRYQGVLLCSACMWGDTDRNAAAVFACLHGPLQRAGSLCNSCQVLLDHCALCHQLCAAGIVAIACCLCARRRSRKQQQLHQECKQQREDQRHEIEQQRHDQRKPHDHTLGTIMDNRWGAQG